MAENFHAIKFTIFSRYCKNRNDNGEHWCVECLDKRHKMLTGKIKTKPCSKAYCPVFIKTYVVRQNIIGGIDKTDEWYGKREGAYK